MLDRNDPSVSQSSIEALILDPSTRKDLIEFFANAIDRAHATGPSRWCVSLRTQKVTLNVGRLLAFRLEKDRVQIALLMTALSAESVLAVRHEALEEEPFLLEPDAVIFAIRPDRFVGLIPSLRPAFDQFVIRAATTAAQTPYFGAHSPGVISYLSHAVGRTLPSPQFKASVNGTDDVDVYWVNQGETYLRARSGKYVWAPTHARNGAELSHWSRVGTLEEGDVLVHYASPTIRAISRVTGPPTLAPMESEHELAPHEKEGWRVPVEYFEPKAQLRLSDVGELIRPHVGREGPFDRNGNIKQGYLFDLTPTALGVILEASDENWPEWAKRAAQIPEQPTWIFQANPSCYDLRGAVNALDEIDFRVVQHKDQIRPGHRVYLYECGDSPGVDAIATVLTMPMPCGENPAERPFCLDKSLAAGADLAVRLRIDRALTPPLARAQIEAVPALHQLSVLRYGQLSNYPVTSEEAEALDRLTRNSSKRIVKIAPGWNAKFWDECREGGYICVGWDDVGDLGLFATYEEFLPTFAEHGEPGKFAGHVTLKSKELWTLRELRPGDQVVANQGISHVLGIGEVIEPGYRWRPERAEFKHTVAVRWDTTKAGPIPPQKVWAMRTVDDVPEEVMHALLGTSRPSPPPPPPPVDTNGFAKLRQALAADGLAFRDELIAHFLLALETRRFVILTGISGTGKTKLAMAVAKHYRRRTVVRRAVSAGDGAVVRHVKPYMLKHRKLMVPVDLFARLGSDAISRSEIVMEYPDGRVTLTAYRTPDSNVLQVSFGRLFHEWFSSRFRLGDEFWLDASEENPGVLQLSVPRVEEIDEHVENSVVVAVRPDWTDPRGLLGYFNPITKTYNATPLLRLLLRAREEWSRAVQKRRIPHPFFAILDEMNLSRVEHYFSDFLSAMESDEAIHLHDQSDLEEVGDERDDEVIPMNVKVPPNLFFVGTVNVDETTFMFSPKVLDRAFVLEFDGADLATYGEPLADSDREVTVAETLTYRPAHLSDWQELAQLAEGDARERVRAVAELLTACGRPFGYRVANEVARFLNLYDARVNSERVLDDGIDLALLSKVLPKLHGTQQELEPVLTRLLAFANDGTTKPASVENQGLPVASLDTSDPTKPPLLPRTAAKIRRMLQTVRARGFASFIE